MDKKTALLALNFLTVCAAFVGLILIIFLTSSGSFSFELNLIGLVLALTAIAAGVIYHFRVSKTQAA